MLQLLLCGCAHSTAAHAVGPDEQQGLKLLEENTKAGSAGTLSDAEVGTILNDNVGRGGQADGMVVGIVDEHGPRIISAGTVGDGSGRPVDGDSVFEIGSITKVFTALLLEDMLERGQMKLDDPVQKYLPDSVKIPRTGANRSRCLIWQRTRPACRDWADLGGPTDTVEHLYAALSHLQAPARSGREERVFESRCGAAGPRDRATAGEDYETLVVQRICQPLGMDSTAHHAHAPARSAIGPGTRFPRSSGGGFEVGSRDPAGRRRCAPPATTC